MSPEQRAGKEVTVRSDIYSLGLVLYEIFTGRHALLSGPQARGARSSGLETPVTPSSLVEGLDPLVERVILRCLTLDSRDRPASALAVAAALPGGDPLAAALAAGETPSPEMVAAAGDAGALRPVVAWSWFGGVIVGLVLVFSTVPQTRLIERVGLHRSPDILAERAREIVRKLGHGEAPPHSAYGFYTYGELLRHIEEKDPTSHRWSHIAAARPTAVLFWYRASPRPLVPGSLAFFNVTVNRSDPPRVLSGMVNLDLDADGRLAFFEAIPPQRDESKGPWPEPDWDAALAEAGLEKEKLEPVRPIWNPLVDCDARAAWEVADPREPGATIRYEAGAYHGKVVYFDWWAPWDTPFRMEEYKPSTGEKAGQYLGVTLVVILLGGSALLARRNLRLGRGDRRGAFRLASFLFLTSMTVWVLRVRHVPDVNSELGLFWSGLGWALLQSCLFWMLYVALEPLVRRMWPNSLISWNRVLAGAVRDPLVGRDLMVGCLFGALAVLSGPFGPLLDSLLGYPPPPPAVSTAALLGVRDVLAELFNVLVSNPLFPLGLLFFLVLFRVVLRKPWLATATAFVVFGTLFSVGSRSFYPSSLLGAVFAAGALLVVVRCGALAVTVAFFVSSLLSTFPLTSNLSGWYAGHGLFALAVVAALAAYGFHASLAGRPMFGRGMLQD